MQRDELRARLLLRAAKGVTDQALNRMIASCGSAVEALRLAPWETAAGRARMDPELATRVSRGMQIIDELHVHVLAPDIPGYPRRLLERLQDRAPSLLFVRGCVDMLDDVGIAVVGSRTMSEYGRSITDDFSRAIASEGYAVISGLALGVDAVAHDGALAVGGITIAVLGSGIDVVYPPRNHRIHERIAQQGALVTQFLPSERPAPYHFPERNLVMAAMSEGVLVVEAGMRSGATITAHHAVEFGVDVMAIPGAIGRPTSIGTNALIREGAACVTSIDDVFETMSTPRRSDELAAQRARHAIRTITAAASDDGSGDDDPAGTDMSAKVAREPSGAELQVRAAIGRAVSSVDEIAERTGLAIGIILAALFQLERDGAVRQHPGSRFELRR